MCFLVCYTDVKHFSHCQMNQEERSLEPLAVALGTISEIKRSVSFYYSYYKDSLNSEPESFLDLYIL